MSEGGGRRPDVRAASEQGLGGRVTAGGREGQTVGDLPCAKAWGCGRDRLHLAPRD